MIKRLIFLILPIFFSILFLSNANADKCDEGSWNQILLENKLYHYETPFLEERNDIGIFFDFEWDSETQKIIIKRDKNEGIPHHYNSYTSTGGIDYYDLYKKGKSNFLEETSKKIYKTFIFDDLVQNFDLKKFIKLLDIECKYKLHTHLLTIKNHQIYMMI